MKMHLQGVDHMMQAELNNVTLEEVKAIVSEYSKDEVLEITPCGNHELNRNLVYLVSFKAFKIVIKVFFKPIRSIRELKVIPLFEKYNPLKILANGKTIDGYDWIIYNYLDGWLLDHIYDDLDLDQLREIFYQLGYKLAMFHSIDTYEFFGDWDVEKQSFVSEYQSFIKEDCERLIENLELDDNEHRLILMKAVENLRSEYSNIRDLKLGRLCHRDLDGRNVMIHVNLSEGLKLEAFLDFEKTVVFNEYLDIVNLYRRYFIFEPKLIEPFFRGYEEVLPIDASFNRELRFNLYRIGIDICSWAKQFSERFYLDTIKYLKRLEAVDSSILDTYGKK